MNAPVLSQAKVAKPQGRSETARNGWLLQRKCACGAATASLTEECEGCKSNKRLQPKLAIGSSNHPLEREADRVADQVLAAPAHHGVSNAPVQIQRFTGHAGGSDVAAPASVDRVLSGSGSAMDLSLRSDMERRFGHDFSRVRIHSDAAAHQSARDVNADAYTVGHNIVFGRGQFAPMAQRGRRLLAHELTHVLQQSQTNGAAVGASNTPLLQRQITVPMEPWVRPAPIPIPNIGPVPEVGPLPPMTIPRGYDSEPELEIDDLPEEEELEDLEDLPESEPEAEPESEPEEQPAPKEKPEQNRSRSSRSRNPQKRPNNNPSKSRAPAPRRCQGRCPFRRSFPIRRPTRKTIRTIAAASACH